MHNLKPIFTIELSKSKIINLYITNISTELIYKIKINNYELEGYLLLDYDFYDYDLNNDIEEFINEILDKIDYYEIEKSLSKINKFELNVN